VSLLLLWMPHVEGSSLGTSLSDSTRLPWPDAVRDARLARMCVTPGPSGQPVRLEMASGGGSRESAALARAAASRSGGDGVRGDVKSETTSSVCEPEKRLSGSSSARVKVEQELPVASRDGV
jgi:hypothetical protein